MTIDTTGEPTTAEARTLFTQTVKKTATAPDAGEPTVVVADDKATALAGLAWSEDDGDGETIQFDADRTTTFWLWLNVATTAALVLVLGVVLWFVLSDHRQPARDDASPASSAPDVVLPSSPPAAAPAPMSSVTPTPIAPPVAAPPPEPTWAAPPAPTSAPVQADPPPMRSDAPFVAAMRAHGITFESQTRAIGAARQICQDLGQGYTKPNVVAALQNANPGFTNPSAYEFLGLATTFYCPQYNR